MEDFATTLQEHLYFNCTSP